VTRVILPISPSRRGALGLLGLGALAASAPAQSNQGAPVPIPGLRAFDLAPRAGGPTWRIFLRIPPGAPPAAGWPALFLLDANAVMGIATDALRVQAAEGPFHGVLRDVRRFDTGNPLGWLTAVVELALEDARIGDPFRAWLQDRV